MNKQIALYRRELRKRLFCGPGRKKKLLSKFDSALAAFLEDCSAPSYEQLEAAFGPPGEMAAVLMETVPREETRRFRLWCKARMGVLVLLITLIILFGFYAYFLKEWTVITVYDDVYPVSSTTFQEDGS